MTAIYDSLWGRTLFLHLHICSPSEATALSCVQIYLLKFFWPVLCINLMLNKGKGKKQFLEFLLLSNFVCPKHKGLAHMFEKIKEEEEWYKKLANSKIHE